MRCTIVETYLKKHDCHETNITEEMLKHLTECKDCRHYYRLVSALELQKGTLEKAPEEMLRAIEMRLINSTQIKPKESFIFTSLLKPSFAGICIVLACIVAYTYLANKKVGYVENLSERFKLAQFENIKAGDMLYAGNNTTTAIRLTSKNDVQIHKNTTVKVHGTRHLSLSRGAVSLQTKDRELQIAIPDGLIRARNNSARIETTSKLDNGVVKTETTCLVFKGELAIRTSQCVTMLSQGLKAVINDNGKIIIQQALNSTEIALEKYTEEKYPVFAAVESLCECIHYSDHEPGKKVNHLQFLGKEANESKFKVRVFWKAEKLNGLAFEPANKNDNICLVKTRRIRV